MTNPVVEIGLTALAVVVFILIVAVSGILGMQKIGTLVALVVFVLLVGGAGYMIAEKTYE